MRSDGSVEESMAEYRRAAETYRAEGDPRGEAHAIRHVGDILSTIERLDDADACYLDALALYERHGGDDLDVANALRGYAVLRDQQGLPSSALWRRALTLYEAAGVPAGIEECRKHVG
ncbi:MAG TPA: tetratricopeptide repeat protein [Candidatus Elarobacter sp.]|nr:tetratricopeptide repeat protein [Candidatus Elarobacter sp.]